MRQYPLKVLDQAENWPRLLAVLDWVVRHPGANIYLRQIDASGVDTKFIEQHRACWVICWTGCFSRKE
jgi:hypothetical protein